jgi:hemolysin activation/secretion protein
MKKHTKLPLFLVVVFLTFYASSAHATLIPAKEQIGAVDARKSIEVKDEKLRKNIQKKRAAAPIEQPVAVTEAQVPEGDKVAVKKIEVIGATFISAKKISKITKPYENKDLSMRSMQEIANKITDLYRQSGYITSRAILPPQKVEGGVLKIEVVEGRMGTIQVQGNKYFSSALIKRKIDLKPGQAFDYAKLQDNLSLINQYPDRKVQTVLKPSETQGATDLILNVKDTLPVHIGGSYDNYGSRYLRRSRYEGYVTDNNLLGFDDIMTVMYQVAEGQDTYSLTSVRYLVPVTNNTQIGFAASKNELELGKEFEDIDARGKSSSYSLFMTNALLRNDTTDVSLTSSMDYKDVYNFASGIETSRDRLRVGRLALKLDKTDDFNGRTIINNEISQGVPSRWGALEENDIRASRAGAGGLFTKDVIDVLRLQRMPLESTILLKGQAQFASHILTSSEQFQLGGIYNVRGYMPGDAVGDRGLTLTGEMGFPIYGLSRSINAPFSKAKLYDATRLAIFYDWGTTSFREVAPGDIKNSNLSSVGWGVRYDLPESFSVRMDMAWPLDNTPSDGKNVHTWVKVSKEF